MANDQIEIRGVDGGFSIVPNLIIRDPDISDNAVRIYCLICSFADNESRTAFPGIRKLSRITGKSRNTLRSGIKELEAVGWLLVEARTAEGGRQTSNLYTVFLNRPGQILTHPAGRGQQADGGRGQNSDGGRVPPVDPLELDSQELDPEDKDIVDVRPRSFEDPSAYTVPEIRKEKLTRSQWEQLLEQEIAGRNRAGVVKFVKGKLKKRHPLEKQRGAMLEAMDAATVVSFDDPGMGAQFGTVLKKLWPDTGYYSPEDLRSFADEMGPVENVHFLPGALSAWRNKEKASQNGKPKGRKLDADTTAYIAKLKDYSAEQKKLAAARAARRAAAKA